MTVSYFGNFVGNPEAEASQSSKEYGGFSIREPSTVSVKSVKTGPDINGQ